MRWALALAACACGDNDPFEPTCPAGTVPSLADTCEVPGVPPSLCPIGFAHDGGSSCAPVLPVERCPAGTLAVPGDLACHTLGSCGTGTWGDIPVGPGTVYVDASYPGTDGNGTIDKPWPRIQSALNTAPAYSLIAVAAGDYHEAIVFYTPMRLWGVCAERVRVVSTFGFPNDQTTLRIYPNAAQSEVHGVSFGADGFAIGISIDGADLITLENVWLRSSLVKGLVVQNPYSGNQTSVTVRGGLFERGIDLQGERLSLEDVAVRNADGIVVRPGATFARRGFLEVRNSVIEDNLERGIRVSSSDAVVDGVVVRGTQPQQPEGFGDGIALLAGSTGRVTRSVIEANHDAGVLVGWNSQATLDGIVVRGTRQRAAMSKAGHGIAIAGCPPEQTACNPELRTSAIVRQSLVEDNQEAGISVTGADATIDRVLVQKTLLGSDGYVGDGILVLDDGVVATATVTRTRSDDNVRSGLASFGGSVTLGANVLACNSFDLSTAYSELLDLGANHCGCDALAACDANTGDLMPPTRSW